MFSGILHFSKRVYDFSKTKRPFSLRVFYNTGENLPNNKKKKKLDENIDIFSLIFFV